MEAVSIQAKCQLFVSILYFVSMLVHHQCQLLSVVRMHVSDSAKPFRTFRYSTLETKYDYITIIISLSTKDSTYLNTYRLSDLFSHASHTQHSCKIQYVDFQMGCVILTNYFNSHPKSLV